MPVPGDNFASMRLRLLLLVALFVPLEAGACDYPDEGTMPLHRAITKVKLRPEVEAWSAERLRQDSVVQYALFLDRTVRRNGRCHWTVEARADGRTWQRYYVTPDGRSVISETAGRPRGAAR